MARASTSTRAAPGMLEHAGTGAGGSSRGDDVVEEHDLVAGQPRPGRFGDGEGPRHVLAALLPAEADLGLRAFDAMQRQGLVPPPRLPGDLLCQQCRLIEAAGRKAHAGERHRHDKVGVG